MADRFEDLTNDELFAIGKQFGCEVRKTMNKDALVKELGDDGVTYQMYMASVSPDDEETAPVGPVDESIIETDDEIKHLVKMTRTNGTYEVRGYRFTREHPYALVSEEDADFLIEHGGGFQLASPRELKQYYCQ